MIRALLDTNIILDLMDSKRPCNPAASELVEAAEAGEARLCIAATSLKDAAYIANKFIDKGSVGAWLDFFLDSFEILGLDREICLAARANGEPDFEDGVIRATAEKNLVDVIVTRDKKAFVDSDIKKMKADELVEQLSE